MQRFHADCIITISLTEKGKPARYVAEIHVDEWVDLKKFYDSIPRKEAETRATIIALEQALRLQQDKIAIRANFTVAEKSGDVAAVLKNFRQWRIDGEKK